MHAHIHVKPMYFPFDRNQIKQHNNDVIEVPTVQTISNSVKIKKEVASSMVRKPPKNNRFTEEEDNFIREGIKKHGNKNWSEILKDPNYHFHPSRTRDALRMRVETNAFKRQVECYNLD